LHLSVYIRTWPAAVNTISETALPTLIAFLSGILVWKFVTCWLFLISWEGDGWEEHWSRSGLLIMQQSSSAMGINEPSQER